MAKIGKNMFLEGYFRCACACKQHMKHLDNCTYNKLEKFALKHTGEDAGCVIEI